LRIFIKSYLYRKYGDNTLDNALSIGRIGLEKLDSILERMINKSTNLQEAQKTMLLAGLNGNLSNKNILKRNVNGY